MKHFCKRSNKGDGYKFRGTGALQLTGCDNYQLLADYVDDPEVMNQGCDYVSRKYTFMSAGVWWKENNMNALCDRNPTVLTVTRRVNGGTNGLRDRQKYYRKATQIIKTIGFSSSSPKSTERNNIVSTTEDLAGRIIQYMKGKGYKIFTAPKEYNIVYVEGMNMNGTLNDDRPNFFNDLRIIIEFVDGKPKIIGKWIATTEPGTRYTVRPMNVKGAARIQFGQYRAWQVGSHKNHEALVQTGGKVTVCRDLNKDYLRIGDKLDTGFFGINQHWGYNHSVSNIGGASAGCAVGRTTKGHQKFMSIVKQDARYKKNDEYIFYSTFIPGNELV